MIHIKTSYEGYVPELKVAKARELLDRAQGASWTSPTEFADLFPGFDSDVRNAMRLLVTAESSSDSKRVALLANIVNYIGLSFGSVEHRAIYRASALLWGNNNKDIPEYLLQAIKLWVPRRNVPRTLEGLKTYLGEEFVSNWEKFKSIQYLATYIRDRINVINSIEAEPVDKLDEMGKLEEKIYRMELAINGRLPYSGNRESLAKLIERDKGLYEKMRLETSENLGDSAKAEDEMYIGRIIHSILTGKNRDRIWTYMDSSMDREWPDKVTVFISLAKLYLE